MGFLGLDSQRAPLELWDVLWINSLKEDDRWAATDDARMSIAMEEMRLAREMAEDAVFQRGEAAKARKVLKDAAENPGSVPEEEVKAAAAEVADFLVD